MKKHIPQELVAFSRYQKFFRLCHLTYSWISIQPARVPHLKAIRIKDQLDRQPLRVEAVFSMDQRVQNDLAHIRKRSLNALAVHFA